MGNTGSLPVLGTQNGSIFADRFDPSLFWYLPLLQPADPTDAFSFAATVGPQVDSAGNPFDSATVSIPLTVADPPDVLAARQASPAAAYQVIPAASYDVTLAVPYVDGEGAAQASSVSGTVTTRDDGSLLAVFPGLLGPAVVQEYVALATVGGSTLAVGYSFEGWTRIVRPFPVIPVAPVALPPLPVRPVPDPVRPVPVGPEPVVTAMRPQEPVPLPTLPVRRPIPVLPPDPFPVRPPIPQPPIPPVLWVVATARQAVTVTLGTTYAQQPYRPLYTLTEPPATTPRPIVNVSDLTMFTTGSRTEYLQLSSLGNVPARYPSLTGVYLGQVSGTVVAVPAAYGIVHSSVGCEMSINAVVDTNSVSGSQFQVSLTLRPMIDPCDLAQLAADVQGVPEARNLRLTVAPPVGLAAAAQTAFSISETVTNLVIVDGQEPGTVAVSFLVADFRSDQTVIPAWATINELILQLTSALTPPPLFGAFALKLDDAYPEPPQASFFLALTATAPSRDTTVTFGQGGASPAPVTVTNQSPNDLLLLRLGLTTAAGQADQDLGQQVLPAGQATSISVAQQPSAAVVSTALSVPSPFPRGALQNYITVTAESVEQIQHQLTVNATAIDFAALGIASITVQITLTALPSVVVAPFTLNPTINVASATITVPIGSALIGLSASLAVTLVMPDGSSGGVRLLATDFMTNPIFVLTPGYLPGAS